MCIVANAKIRNLSPAARLFPSRNLFFLFPVLATRSFFSGYARKIATIKIGCEYDQPQLLYIRAENSNRRGEMFFHSAPTKHKNRVPEPPKNLYLKVPFNSHQRTFSREKATSAWPYLQAESS